MGNSYFRFKQFTIHQDRCAMKVTTDACLFGAWVAEKVHFSGLPAKSCLDAGAGTGLLSLMLAQKNPQLKIDAIEIDTETALQAKANAEASPWKNQVFVLPGDVKDIHRNTANEYDIIISNPPFYENELKSADLKKNIAHHEEGLLLEDLLGMVENILAPGGSFYIMLPYKRRLETGSRFQKHCLEIVHLTQVKQSTQHEPFRIFIICKRAGNSADTYFKDEIAVWDDQQRYTHEFKRLLKDYYLNF